MTKVASEVTSGEAFARKLKNAFIGKAKDVQDKSTFHKISLIAFFAWIGLGVDGLSSSCYGPEEAFRHLQDHPSLALFVALGTAFTIFIISSSYNQIVKLFPHGGGGYLVGSKLLSPTVGMVSGCALIIDYVLTIAISVSSGTDAIFSFLPVNYQSYKLVVAMTGVGLLILLNLRGVKESVVSLTPFFAIFIITHVFAIVYVIITHGMNFTHVAGETAVELRSSVEQLGLMGTVFLILKAYSMGAGTYTGIEAVSNGLPILREPKVVTARKTMILMAASLSFMVLGLMVAYMLYGVRIDPNKTLNAVLLDHITSGWSHGLGIVFVLITLLSEAVILFVAAQTGFIDGPRVMANMAVDLWFPKRFATLSDRLVTMNGVFLMGIASLVLLVITTGKVKILVVLYSINVFITFSISQLGMVRHWWISRKKVNRWRGKLTVNGIGFILTTFILITIVIMKFLEGGWITLIITGLLVVMALNIRKHYYQTKLRLQKLRLSAYATLENEMSHLSDKPIHQQKIEFDPKSNTAVILVSGFGGTGLTTFLKTRDSFNGFYKNYVFVRIGIINSRIYRGAEELDHFKENVKEDGKKYVNIANQLGLYGKSIWTIGTDPVEEVYRVMKRMMPHMANVTFFGGQLVFSRTFYLSQLLHNHTIFSIQKRFFKFGIPIVIFPIRID